MSNILTNQAPVLILCGPSGVGKSTILKLLLRDFPGRFGFSISHTTRSLRPGEQEGVHYHTVSKQAMEDGIEKGEFAEHATVHGNLYGTSFQSIEKIHKKGQICLMDVDSHGATCLKQTKYPLDVKCIGIVPPSFSVLEQRLRDRKSETENQIQTRLSRAMSDVEFCTQSPLVDKVIVNFNSWKSYKVIRRVITHQWWSPLFDHECDRHVMNHVTSGNESVHQEL